jgi:DNA-binding MarR family transcriptional regulator
MVLMTRLSKVVHRLATDEVLGMNFRDYMALCQLREQRTVSQQAFCEGLHLDPNNCVLLLNSLEANGLVERRRDPADRRRHSVSLTPNGRKQLERADRALETVEDQVLGALSEDERATLHGLLVRAVGGVAREASAAGSRSPAVTG